jgi:hypothetical protein
VGLRSGVLYGPVEKKGTTRKSISCGSSGKIDIMFHVDSTTVREEGNLIT